MSAIRLENDSLTVSVLPQIGAKIYDLIDRRSAYNFLWHNPRIAPQPYPIEANFDNYWCGGWDDGFPTCEACTHGGEQYPNLGELRSVHWTVDGHDDSTLTLSAFGPISPIKAQKQIRLRETSLETEFTIEHQGFLPIDYLWGTHPAYAVEPGCIIHIPARSGIVGQANDPLFGEPGQRYSWPILPTEGAAMVMSVMHSAGRYSAGHYATDLEAGWYALEYPQRGIGLLFEFPLDLCPYLWLWLSYGGWRGYYLAVVEPWTSHPVTLSDAVTARTHRVLTPGERICFKTQVTPWSSPATLDTVLRKNGLIET